MRILDVNNHEVHDPDLTLGYVKPDSIFVCHHDAVQEVAEQSHPVVVATYPNGGRDIEKVIDVAYVPPQEAWNEYEDIYRYVLYTPEELDQLNKPKPDSDASAVYDSMAKAIKEGVGTV